MKETPKSMLLSVENQLNGSYFRFYEDGNIVYKKGAKSKAIAVKAPKQLLEAAALMVGIVTDATT